jgi:hypothetical protein
MEIYPEDSSCLSSNRRGSTSFDMFRDDPGFREKKLGQIIVSDFLKECCSRNIRSAFA